MRGAGVGTAAACVASIAFGVAIPGAAIARSSRTHLHPPVVVELYTAQGCGPACTDANAVIGDLSGRGDVIALTFSVDYWDYLGWKDTFAQPGFAERQRAYVTRLKARDVYTPEVVVDGRGEAAGMDAAKVDALVEQARAARTAADAPPPPIRFPRRGARVRVGEGEAPRGTADVWLVRYDPKERVVKVKGDDRKLRSVAVYDAVRELTRLGGWRGAAKTYPLPEAKAEGLETVVLVQGARGGAILAAAKE